MSLFIISVIVFTLLFLIYLLWLPKRLSPSQYRPIDDTSDLTIKWADVLKDVPKTQLNYLVMGGSGFLGRHIVNQLVLRGDHVRIFDRVECSLFKESKSVEFFKGDITNFEDVLQATKNIDVVFHVASLIRPFDTAKYAYPLNHAVNVKGVENVVAACLEHNVSKLVYTSTSYCVVGPNPRDENSPYCDENNCSNYYGLTKALGEKVVLAANNKTTKSGKKLLTGAIRPTAITGWGDPYFINKVLTDGPFANFSPNFDMDWVHAHNCAYAHLLLESRLGPNSAGMDCSGHQFIISDINLKYEDLYRLLFHFCKKILNKNYKLQLLPFRLFYLIGTLLAFITKTFKLDPLKTFGEIAMAFPSVIGNFTRGSVYHSVKKAQTMLGYVPPFPFDQAIQRSVRELKANAFVVPAD